MKVLTFFSVISIGVVSAFAGGADNATIVELMIDKNIAHSVYVKVQSSNLSNNSCNTNSSGWNFVVYDDGQIGKNMLAMLLTAYSTGISISIQGEGTCEGETEKLKRITFKK